MKTLQTGFTLVELMITVVILTILATIAYPSYDRYVQRARVENVRATMTDIIHVYEKNYAQFKTFCVDDAKKIVDDSACAAMTSLPSTVPANEYYTVEPSIQSSNFILAATPLRDKSESALIYVVYDSATASFARCNKAGFAVAKAANANPGSDCEVF